MSDVLYQVRNLKKYYVTERDFLGRATKTVKGCDDVSFDLYRGETLGVVGESGCGKSTVGKTLIKLQEPTDGQLIFDGQDITRFNTAQMRPLRHRIQFIFQDPYASLNPRYTILAYVREPLDVFRIGEPSEREARARETLEYVGIPSSFLYRYPHELSGGQRQRVVIARAIISSPDLIICDEPVSALDVSVRAQVLNLMRAIQRERGLTYLFISHDMSVIRHLADRVMVMYLGRIVEIGTMQQVLDAPLHPYTKVLLSAVPVPDVHARRHRLVLQGDVPSPINPPKHCRFAGRCPFAREACFEDEQSLLDAGNGHLVACERYKELESEA